MTSLRVAAEERRNAHGQGLGDQCYRCEAKWPCADRVFAELVITTLDQHRSFSFGDRVAVVPDPLGEHAN